MCGLAGYLIADGQAVGRTVAEHLGLDWEFIQYDYRERLLEKFTKASSRIW